MVAVGPEKTAILGCDEVGIAVTPVLAAMQYDNACERLGVRADRYA
jgi:hypothetical protein